MLSGRVLHWNLEAGISCSVAVARLQIGLGGDGVARDGEEIGKRACMSYCVVYMNLDMSKYVRGYPGLERLVWGVLVFSPVRRWLCANVTV